MITQKAAAHILKDNKQTKAVKGNTNSKLALLKLVKYYKKKILKIQNQNNKMRVYSKLALKTAAKTA